MWMRRRIKQSFLSPLQTSRWAEKIHVYLFVWVWLYCLMFMHNVFFVNFSNYLLDIEKPNKVHTMQC